MIRAKITKHMVSFIPVRRGDWIFKISVWKNKQVMVIAQNCIDLYRIHIECFSNQDDAADYIERLSEEL
jgi:hypothetical protein